MIRKKEYLKLLVKPASIIKEKARESRRVSEEWAHPLLSPLFKIAFSTRCKALDYIVQLCNSINLFSLILLLGT